MGVLSAIWEGLQEFFQIIKMAAEYIGKGFSFLWSGITYVFGIIAELPPWLLSIAALVIVLAVVKLILGR